MLTKGLVVSNVIIMEFTPESPEVGAAHLNEDEFDLLRDAWLTRVLVAAGSTEPLPPPTLLRARSILFAEGPNPIDVNRPAIVDCVAVLRFYTERLPVTERTGRAATRQLIGDFEEAKAKLAPDEDTAADTYDANPGPDESD